jgi:GTP-binding protein HflX
MAQPKATESASTRAFVVHPALTSVNSDFRKNAIKSPENRLAEAVGLATALGVDIVAAEIAPTPVVRAATLFGGGKTIELGQRIKDERIDLVAVNAALTPIQQRNLEKTWKTKVLDRAGLILEIFGGRAQTREGVLQVELAHCAYQKSRLVRSWTHLERQRGGAGFMGGPGERQIESDRRQLAAKILRLERKLAKVVQTRQLHRDYRSKRGAPVVALVGYTNAGKSTLFNRLSKANVLAEDMLFATLDPTMRSVTLLNGREIVLSDTVGFISDLPTELIAAFRATLEEVTAADLILHIRDIAHEDTETQREDVLTVLRDLGLCEEALSNIIEVHNKVDLLSETERLAVENAAARSQNAVCMSAHTGDGVASIHTLIQQHLDKDARSLRLELKPQQGAELAWLHANSLVLRMRGNAENGQLMIDAQMRDDEIGRFEKRFGKIKQFQRRNDDTLVFYTDAHL